MLSFMFHFKIMLTIYLLHTWDLGHMDYGNFRRTRDTELTYSYSGQFEVPFSFLNFSACPALLDWEEP